MITNNVGNAFTNRHEDVRNVKSALERLGRFDFRSAPEPHGYITRELDDSIKKYQKDRGLNMDGFLRPDGETESRLLKELRKRVSDDIKKEELPPPNIPGTNIPDEGIPEGWMPPKTFTDKDRKRYEIDPGIEKNPPSIDPDILLPYDPGDPAGLFTRFKKYRDL